MLSRSWLQIPVLLAGVMLEVKRNASGMMLEVERNACAVQPGSLSSRPGLLFTCGIGGSCGCTWVASDACQIGPACCMSGSH
eukprot:1156843-Pelagomonas_calceolata.AAC.4